MLTKEATARLGAMLTTEIAPFSDEELRGMNDAQLADAWMEMVDIDPDGGMERIGEIEAEVERRGLTIDAVLKKR